eukprot:scaffold647849_cov34-Prasinocladus_malaysianus.AAC.1
MHGSEENRTKHLSETCPILLVGRRSIEIFIYGNDVKGLFDWRMSHALVTKDYLSWVLAADWTCVLYDACLTWLVAHAGDMVGPNNGLI